MRKAIVYVNEVPTAELVEHSPNEFELSYLAGAQNNISLTLPRQKSPFRFSQFPAFFEGLLPEGAQLTALLRQNKIDEWDFFSQLLAVGEDLVGAVTVKKVSPQ